MYVKVKLMLCNIYTNIINLYYHSESNLYIFGRNFLLAGYAMNDNLVGKNFKDLENSYFHIFRFSNLIYYYNIKVEKVDLYKIDKFSTPLPCFAKFNFPYICKYIFIEYLTINIFPE